jgi:uncharacterized protein YdhG (YjbR/CyaY superfamily)
MQKFVSTPDDYIDSLPDDRKEAIQRLRKVIKENLPEGFVEAMSYGMIGYVVPHSIYPKGYKSDPKLPLPFIAIASQKNNIAVHHMGLYADQKLLNWFTDGYMTHSKYKLDMGKGCIRLKKIDAIPYDLFGQLASKVTVPQWIKTYESMINKSV